MSKVMKGNSDVTSKFGTRHIREIVLETSELIERGISWEICYLGYLRAFVIWTTLRMDFKKDGLVSSALGLEWEINICERLFEIRC